MLVLVLVLVLAFRSGQRAHVADHIGAQRHRRQKQCRTAGEDERCAQTEMLAQPATEQRAGTGGDQDQPPHRAGHAAQQMRRRDGLAKREKVDEYQHRTGREQHQHHRECRHAKGVCRRGGQQQPARTAHREAEHQARTRTDSPADPAAEHAREHRADTHAHVAQADRLLREAERARREQDLHNHRSVIAHLPDPDRHGERHEQSVLHHEAHAGAQVAQKVRFGARSRVFEDHDTAQDRGRDEQQHCVDQQRDGRTDHLDQRTREPRPGDLRARNRQRVSGMRLDQAIARHHLGEHDLRG